MGISATDLSKLPDIKSSTTWKCLHTPRKLLHITYQLVYWFRQGTTTEGITEGYSNCSNQHAPISNFSHYTTKWTSYHLFTNNRKTTGGSACSNTSTVEKWLKARMKKCLSSAIWRVSRTNTGNVSNHRVTVWRKVVMQYGQGIWLVIQTLLVVSLNKNLHQYSMVLVGPRKQTLEWL